MDEPRDKRVVAFVDGQNLFYAAKKAFGYDFPNYDPLKLVQLVCTQRTRWNLELYFYTGLPSPTRDEPRHRFWEAKLGAMGKNSDLVQTFSRPLVYRGGTAQEKGIDVRLAIDAVRLVHEAVYDVALIFSQDQDFTEVAVEVRRIAAPHDRWIKVACAFPVSPSYLNKRGIDKTDWIGIDQTLYDQAVDPVNYRWSQ